jgi:hypothetical protein
MKTRLGGWTTAIWACIALIAAPLALVGATGRPAGATPPALSLSTTSVAFPETTLGDIRLTDVTVTNTSSGYDFITGATASGADPNDFGVLPGADCQVGYNLVITLPPGGRCTIAAAFLPGALGARSATLTLIDNDNSGASIGLTGSGGIGYYQVSNAGAVAAFGNAVFLGDASKTPLNHPIVGMAQTGDTGGYWLVASDGGIFSYGDAGFFGSTGAIPLNKPIVGMAPTADSAGYWLVASDGGIFSYGDAQFFGSTGDIRLNQPIVGMAATPDGNGYWLVASDGGIFAYGDAPFYGSTGDIHLNQPIVGMAPTPDGGGYWLVAADGGVFAYGDAQFHGSTGAIHLNKPIVGTAPMPTGNGYWFTASDGGLFGFGDAPFYGAAASNPIGTVVGMASDGGPTLQAILGLPADRHQVGSGGRGGWGSWGTAGARLHVERGHS